MPFHLCFPRINTKLYDYNIYMYCLILFANILLMIWIYILEKLSNYIYKGFVRFWYEGSYKKLESTYYCILRISLSKIGDPDPWPVCKHRRNHLVILSWVMCKYILNTFTAYETNQNFQFFLDHSGKLCLSRGLFLV